MAAIESMKIVARAITFDGRPVVVSEVKHSGAAIGANSDTTYAVDVAGNGGNPAVSYGFGSKAEAMKFLTSSGKETYKGHDLSGQAMTHERVGLGIPKAMIGGELADDAVTRAPVSTEAEPTRVPAVRITNPDTKPSTEARPGPAVETVTPAAETSVVSGLGTDPAADDNPNTTPATPAQVAASGKSKARSRS